MKKYVFHIRISLIILMFLFRVSEVQAQIKKAQDTFPKFKNYNKFKIGGQLYGEFLLSKNAVFTDYKGKIFNNYLDYVKEYYPENLDYNPAGILELNQKKILGSAFFGYNFDEKNSLFTYLQFIFRYNAIFYENKKTRNSQNENYGNTNIDFVYYRQLFSTKWLRFKLGIGAGIVIGNKLDFTESIFGVNSQSYGIYNGKNAYFYEDSNYVATTEILFHNKVDFNITPRFSLDFTKEDKSYISFIGGMNILPIKYIGVRVQTIDRATESVINQKDFKFNSLSIYFGLGYTFGWKKVDVYKEGDYFYD